jgi:hypothetical protein
MMISFLGFIGCQTAQKAGEEVGKPVGKSFKALGGVSDGALEGYMGQEDEEYNPYGR